MDKVREAILNGDVVGAAKAYVESKAVGHDVEPLELRPEVRKFAEAMEQRLRENEDKGGWEKCGLDYLVNRAVEEVQELVDVVKNGVDPLLDEAADVANFLMMICDTQGEL